MRTAALLLLAQALLAADFTVTFLHVNDTHARIDPTVIAGKPYGGMPRLATAIARERAADPNAILLHAGDAFQGTFYFNVYEGLADLAFFNAMRFDAMAAGNHEFDKGPAALAAFAKHAQFPVLSANLDLDAEPALKPLIARSTVLTRGRERIGIVGGTTAHLLSISNAGPTVKLRDMVASLQAEVDALTRQGIDKIVLLTHIGYPEEQDLARTLRNVDVIVGGHSHTLLGETTAPGWPKPQGPYPTVVGNPDNGKTLVVQSWEGARVLGRLKVTFDGKGRVKKWSATQPLAIGESIPPDPALSALAEAFQKPIAGQRDRKIAVAATAIPQDGPMGRLVADAMLAATAKQGAVAAITNDGGVRAGFEPGDITFGMALSVTPFNNTLVLLDLTGAELQAALAAHRSWTSRNLNGQTLNGRPIDPAAIYRVVVNNFMANGGDGYLPLRDAKGFREDTGIPDIDAFTEYLQANSPVGAP